MAKAGNLKDLVSLIFNTRRLFVERYRNKKENEFTLLQLETLRYVAENKNPTMKDVADYLFITPPSATALIDLLVKSKKLKRLSAKNDRRLVCLTLTAAGKKSLEAGFKERAMRLKEVLERLKPSDQNNLARILKNISSSIKS